MQLELTVETEILQHAQPVFQDASLNVAHFLLQQRQQRVLDDFDAVARDHAVEKAVCNTITHTDPCINSSPKKETCCSMQNACFVPASVCLPLRNRITESKHSLKSRS